MTLNCIEFYVLEMPTVEIRNSNVTRTVKIK